MVYKGAKMENGKNVVELVVSNDIPDSAEMEWAFPVVNPGMEPFGGRVIVQLRRIKKKQGLIELVSETKESEKWNNMIGKVIALGPLAFRNRESMQSWPEGTWAQVGDFVRVPKWGGDRWEMKDPNNKETKEPVLFMTINDHELISKVTSNPLSFHAYV